MINVGKHDEREVGGSVDTGEDIHPDLISSVNEDMPDEELLYDLAELYKVFGDTTRIKILYVLFEAEMCVGDIAELLNASPSAVSHQLRVLKANKLVKFRREGKTVFYFLADDHVRTIIGQGMDHINE
jgi:ArsR family transcriptional regulator